MLSVVFIVFSLSIVLADPQPTGGASCQTYKDCGGVDGGYCQSKGNQSYCVCLKQRGNPDCSYQRFDSRLAGGLQFLCFIGIGGVGEFILGNTDIAVGELILLSGSLLLLICSCMIFCGAFLDLLFKNSKRVQGLDTATACMILLFFLACFSGLIWNIVDGALILKGFVTDHNGYNTY